MSVRILIPFLVLVFSFASAANAEVRGPWVVTDRTVDCSTYESIAKGVLKPGMTDEEKAIALFHFFRQRVYHYQNLPESREPLKTVNMMGNTLCGSQATCMKGLLENCAGLKARVVSHPGHTFYEVFYDGQWHGFDTMTNFYVFTRGDKRTVASFEELNKDPSLIKEAVKERRSCQNWCPCGDDPLEFVARTQVLGDKPATSSWTVKDYSLRRGEEIVRGWWPEGKPLPGAHRKQEPGPLHTCGGRDRQAEPALFKFWEPYGIPNFGVATVSYRHYVNGQMNYAPDLADKASVLDGGGKLDRLEVSPQGLVGAGTYTFKVKCPFYVTGAVLKFEADCPGDADTIEVEVDQAQGGWVKMAPTKDAGKKIYRVDLDKAVVRANIGRFEYAVKIRLAGKTALNKMHLRTWFVHNAMAAPHLMPGKNSVVVDVANEAALQVAPLTLVYRYRDAPKWTGPLQTVERAIAKSGESLAIDLPQSDKLPQMRDVTLRYGRLGWQENE